jgi:hypothetical protein
MLSKIASNPNLLVKILGINVNLAKDTLVNKGNKEAKDIMVLSSEHAKLR